ncbi:MAG: inorganic phosphate transporter, partial [Endomicrobia bacterium]|nr:inorganic phosphate transporter [Endomicrobiia bacterium]
IFSVVSFILTYFIKKFLYPPRKSNFRLYEKLVYHNETLKKFIVYTDCYSAFAVGSNNIANVVAPLVLTFDINVFLVIFVVGVFFGLGSLVMGGKLLKTVSKDIIPLGQISASVVSLAASTCAVLASILGLPTPYVQFTVFSVLAISSVKESFYFTYRHQVVRRIIYVWFVVPIFTFLLSYILHYFFKL